MSPEDVGKDDLPAAEVEGSKRVLLQPEEWKDPPGRRVIGEYHKGGLPGGPVEAGPSDRSGPVLFDGYKKDDGTNQMRIEYNRDGVSYVEASVDLDGHRPMMGRTPDGAAGWDVRESQEGAQRDDAVWGRSEGGTPGAGGVGRQIDIGELAEAMEGLPPIDRAIDISTLEVIGFALMRVMFGRGLRIPIKRKGFIDMDVLIKDRDVIFDVNTLQFGAHRLTVWRLVFAYKDKPIMELGRGVKNGLKIHRWRAFRLLVALWWQSHKWRRAAAASPGDVTVVGSTEDIDGTD